MLAPSIDYASEIGLLKLRWSQRPFERYLEFNISVSEIINMMSMVEKG